MPHHIFGYGSLVNQDALHRYIGRPCASGETNLCQLQGFRRCWNVAMDNQTDLPGYKYYVDKSTGRRAGIYVTFLNIRKAPGAAAPGAAAPGTAITGIIFKVNEAELALLDQRERNYYRLDVTHQVNVAVEGKVWAYKGTSEAEKRYQRGLHTQTAYISEEYYQFVHDCFYCHGEDCAKAYLNSTDAPEVPLRKLQRINL